MDFSFPNFFHLLHILLFISLVCPVYSSNTRFHQFANQTSEQENTFHKLRKQIANRLQKLNKPAVKTIYSPDGDIIDCVLFHKQPAFDHPLLKGHKLSDPPERPRGYNKADILNKDFQLWSSSGESCPEGTIPIIRTTEEDILRTSSPNRYGQKSINSSLSNPQYVNGVTRGGEYYGAQGDFNVWTPHVEGKNEFSVSQMWVFAGTYGKDLNSIEVGWAVFPSLFGDDRTRLFIYWTADAYQNTGCYNLKCPGFIQTNHKVLLGGTISPISTYNGPQYDVTLSIWKDPRTNNWWLQAGSGILIGYWPVSLFTHLKDHATTVNFGGEIVNTRSTNAHTSTGMGSGHFAGQGFRKAAFIKNMEIVDYSNNLNPVQNQEYIVQLPKCYDSNPGITKWWGRYFFFGGPGRNINCP
ncbi:protein neprosin-like [Cicer arietinum]|uniref:Uncharacterized protein LOC101495424 n=1 Tax=Cicer arietinum TaxID=3827 RepID=A0A1S2Z3F1_CICAR|nr:uncharacterized protein LOC101495424 [Cicer arietinum]